MSKLTYMLNVSLDGFIETPDHTLDWTVIDDELHSWFNERTRECAASIYGRRMYDVMTAYWPTAASDPAATPVMLDYGEIWRAMPKVVFSRTLDSADHGFRLVRGDVGDELAKLSGEFDGEIEVSGPNMASQFIERGLVDEYTLVVHPVILGAGTPFFPRLANPIRLRHVATTRFESGVLAVTYVPA